MIRATATRSPPETRPNDDRDTIPPAEILRLPPARGRPAGAVPAGDAARLYADGCPAAGARGDAGAARPGARGAPIGSPSCRASVCPALHTPVAPAPLQPTTP